MKKLLSSKTLRKIKILEMFAFGKVEIDLRIFAKEWDCSEKSLKLDIDELNRLMEDDEIEFKIIDHNLIVKGFENINYTPIYNAILSNMIEFQVIEHIFFQRSQSMEELADKLFISKASLYRIIQKINDAFDGYYDCHISTSTLKIIGNETIIRTFFAQYLFEKNGYNGNFIDNHQNKNLETIFKIVEQILRKLNLSNDFNVTYWLFHIIVVGLWRYKNNHTMVRTSLPIEKRRYLSELKFNHEYIIFEGIKIPISIEAIEDALGTAFPEGFVENYEDFVSLITKDSSAQGVYDNMIKLKEELVNITGLPIEKSELMMLFIFNISNLNFFNNYYTTFLAPQLVYYDEINLNDRNPIYEFIKDALLKFFLKIGLKDGESRIKTTFFYMILHWDGLFEKFYSVPKPKKCLLLTEFGDAQAKIVKKYLEDQFGRWIDVIIFSDTKINNIKYYMNDIDFIISNVWSVFPNSIPKNIPIFKLSNFPLKNQVDAITEYLLTNRIETE